MAGCLGAFTWAIMLVKRKNYERPNRRQPGDSFREALRGRAWAGTRIPVQSVLELVREGLSFAEIIRDYDPNLEPKDIRACIQHAIDVVAAEISRIRFATPATFISFLWLLGLVFHADRRAVQIGGRRRTRGQFCRRIMREPFASRADGQVLLALDSHRDPVKVCKGCSSLLWPL